MAKTFAYDSRFPQLIAVGRNKGREPFEPPRDWDASCDAIAGECGRPLPPDARVHLWNALEYFQNWSRRDDARPKPRDVRKQIEQIDAAAAELEKLLRSPHEGMGPNAAFDLVRGHIDPASTVNEIPETMRRLRKACGSVLENFDNRFSKDGARRDAVAQLINHLAAVFSSIGGHVGYSKGPGNARTGPFVRFCCAAVDHIECEQAKGKLPDNLGERIKEVVAEYNASWGEN